MTTADVSKKNLRPLLLHRAISHPQLPRSRATLATLRPSARRRKKIWWPPRPAPSGAANSLANPHAKGVCAPAGVRVPAVFSRLSPCVHGPVGQCAAPAKDRVGGRVIRLRRQRLSTYEISRRLKAEDTQLNRSLVAEIPAEEGFG
jgi:hypothetical protein